MSRIARLALFFLSAYLDLLREEEDLRIVIKHFTDLNALSMEDLDDKHAVLLMFLEISEGKQTYQDAK